MKISKLIGVLLVLLVFVLMAVGSGSDSSESSKASSNSAASADSSTAPSGTSSTTDDTKTDSQASAVSSKAADKDVTIEEAVLFDQDDIVITAKSLNMKGFFGPEVKLLIENNSERSVTVQTRNTSVNGYMVETMLSADVAPSKKANDELTLMRSDLEAAGITTIADLEFSFHIFDSESWDTIIDSDPVIVTTSVYDGFEYMYDDSGELVYDEDDIKIVVKGLSENDSIWGPGIVVYIENNTDNVVMIQARDVSINGFMIDPIFSCDISAGKHAIDAITFMSSDLESNEIEQINTCELSFQIMDYDSWDTIASTSLITLEFE